jgi:hypothetical protein
MDQLSLIERAFQIARSGQARTIDDVRRALSREGFEAIDAHIGSATRKQLRSLIIQAQSGPA